jgi:thiamine kinase-like enzyme
MKTPLSLLPNLPRLTAGLTAALSANENPHPIEVLSRKLPRFMYTFPNEIVTCRLPDGRKRRVFIKYGTGRSHHSFGHRGDVCYEAEVYEHLLSSVKGFRPSYLGTSIEPGTGNTWLMLEFAYGSTRVFDLESHETTEQARALADSAGWIGRFHTACEGRIRDPSLSFLKTYDAEYYRGWARRTEEFSRPLRKRFPWLARLREWGDAWFAPLLNAPQTVIHGEFYSKTIMVRKEKLFVVDWESAAVAPGEIDLAALNEGKHWRSKVARQCEREYRSARWPEGAPAEFRRTLNAARAYLHFRWLGERPDWAVREKTFWRYEHLHAVAKKLSLV